MLYFRHVAPMSGSEYYADYLPADTLAAVTLLDLQGMTAAFPESALGSFFAKPTVREILAEQGASEDAIIKYEEFADGAADLLTNPAIEQLFGDDITFALLAPDIARLNTAPEAELKRMLLAFGSSAAAESAAMLARLTLSGFSTETVNGLELTRIRLDNNEYLYGHAQDGVIILSYSPDTITTALRQKAAGGGLNALPAFQAAKKFWTERAAAASCYVKFYTNPEKISKVAAASRQPEFGTAAALLRGVQIWSGVAAVAQGDVQIISRASYDLTGRGQRQPPRQNNMALHLLNEKTLLYGWVADLNNELFAAAGPKQYQMMDAAVQEQLGLSLQELLAALGPQAGLTMGEVTSIGLFPLPRLNLFAQIREPESARRLAARLRQKMAERGFSEKTKEAGGNSITYWPLLPPEAAHPALALTDQMLYFANGEAALQSVMTEEGRGLPQFWRELFGPELAAQFSAANSLALVVRPALLAAAAQKTTNWAATVLPPTGLLAAEKLRAAVLNLLRSLNFTAVWSRVEADHADWVLVLRRNAV